MDFDSTVTQIENGFLVVGPNPVGPMGIYRTRQTIYCADLAAVLECLKKIYPLSFAEMRERQMKAEASYQNVSNQAMGQMLAQKN